MTRRELCRCALIYGFILAALFAATGRTPVHDGRGHDGRFYAAMAADESLAQSFVPVGPYCYRVFTPLLARCLPSSVVNRFLILNALTWLATLVLWHLLARRTGLPPLLALFGGLLYAASAWGPMNAFYNPCYVDPMMHLFLVAGLLLMMGRSRWLLVLLPISVLQREQTAVMLLICAAVHYWMGGMSVREAVDTPIAGGRSPGSAPSRIRSLSHGLGRRAIELAFAAAACVVVFVGLRIAIQPVGGTAPAPWTTAFAVAFNLYDNPRYLAGSILAVAYALGVPLVATLLLPGARRYVNDHRWPLYYLFLCLLCLFGGSDKARLAFVAMPVLLLAMMHGLRACPVFAGRGLESLRRCVRSRESEPRPSGSGWRSVATARLAVREPLPDGRGSDRNRFFTHAMGANALRESRTLTPALSLRGRGGPLRLTLLVLTGLLVVQAFMQFPPALSFIDGRLAAPLIDDPDRGTHLASGIIPAVWPVPLADIFVHMLYCGALCGAILWTVRRGRLTPKTTAALVFADAGPA